MSLKIQVQDGRGTGNTLRVNGEGEVGVVIHTHPPVDEEVQSYPFRQYFTDDGTSGGDNNMIVATATDFWIQASNTRDIFVKLLSIRIGDAAGVTLNAFGGITALSTGCSILYSNDDLGEVTIADQLKTNIDLIRIAPSTGSVGDGTSVYKLDVTGGGTEDSYLPFIDLAQVFGFPWGLRLKKNSNDKLIFRVSDDLTGLVTFNMIGYGAQL